MNSEYKVNKQKRILLGRIFLLFFLYNLNTFRLFSKENTYILEGPLAGSIYYTKEKPGKWEMLVDSHLPQIIKKDSVIEVSTLHEMRGYEHYILKHIVLDNKLNIISEKIFDPSKDTPIPTHNISGYLDKMYVLSICNKHDAWLASIKL